MSTFAIGDEVALPQGHRAILRWIGRIPGRQPIEYAGVEVIGPQAALLGKHSGTYEGQRYFETKQPGTGLFVSYTQLVSANIRTPRLAPPQSPSVVLMGDDSVVSTFGSPGSRAPSPIHREFGREYGREYGREVVGREAVSSSPRFHKVPAGMPGNGGGGGGGGDGAGGSDASSLAAQREFFRNALRATNEKVAELTATFDERLAAVTNDYEQKLKNARRSTTLSSPGGTEVEEQRQALASMQNKLINERTEKQEEIDSLKRELQHMRKLAGSAEDLEQLIGDLGRYEQQLAELRSQASEMETIKKEIEKLRSENAALELAARSPPGSAGDSSYTEAYSEAVETAQNEVSRLEKILEAKLLRESELEALNEQLQAEVAALKDAAGSRSPHPPLTPSPQEEDTKKKEENHERNPLKTHTETHGAKSPNAEKPNIEKPSTEKPGTKKAEMAETKPPTISESIATLSVSEKPSTAVPVPQKLTADYDESSMIVDLAAGRSDWCSLCEREGHTAVDCPYE